MGKIRAVALLVVAMGALAGCGDSNTRAVGSAPFGSGITVNPSGTGSFVPVGSTGLSLFAPPGAFEQEAFLSATPVTENQVIGSPFPGSDSFVTGLQLTTTAPLAQPVELQVPVTTPVGSNVSVFQLNGDHFAPVPVTNAPGTLVQFTATTPGTFVVTRSAR